jgi:predicted negative regulator of RcsB-dependent stress response
MSSSRSEEARNRAQDLFAKAKQRDTDVIEHRTKLQQAGLEKYTRLRALRLAKEAADKEALDRAAAAKLGSGRKAKTPNA